MKQATILPAEWMRLIVVTDRTLPGADDPRCTLRRVGAALAGHVVTGLLNHLDMGPNAIEPSSEHHWLGHVRWRHPIQRLPHKRVTLGRLRRAYSRLLNAHVGGRAAEMRASFGWPDAGVRLDYAAPATESILAIAERLDRFDPGRVIRGSIALNQRLVTDRAIARAIDLMEDTLVAEKRMTGEGASWFTAGILGALNAPKQAA